MENENTKFDSLVNLIKETNEKNSNIKSKINIQIEEMNKIKEIINQHEECLKQQNEVLNKLLDEKLAIKKYKNDLVKELSKIGNSDDEECEININNCQKDFKFELINYVITDAKNYGYRSNMDNRKQIDYYNQTIIDINKPMNNKLKQVSNSNSPHQQNLNCISYDCNEPMKMYLDSYMINDNFIPYQDIEISKSKILFFIEYLNLPENDNSIFNDDEFIKNYKPKLLFQLQNDTVLDMDITEKSLNVCCAKGILLIYDQITNLWSKFYTGNSKNISQYTNSKNSYYLICENEFVISNELKSEVKVFNSKIISKFHKSQRKNKYCCISLENGEIWRYDIKKDRYYKIFSSRSKMKACVNLPYNSSLFLAENGNVFTVLDRNSTRIPELDGCVDILASCMAIAVCYFGNGICKIYDMTKKTLFQLEISESIKLAKHSKSILSLLDIQNRLHLYKFTKKTFTYEEIQVIQIPTNRNISAMSDVFNKQIFITIENEIYSIEYN